MIFHQVASNAIEHPGASSDEKTIWGGGEGERTMITI